ncbi:hypothetical protein [Alkalibacterium sp. 20]|uniref:hypothetical protein n=1 Tax=Alkalibacterium sp. 20 TaxID=1798803 RepID=UPI0009001172|nr:hypothetical protein [Alkalibacterium sp. 20]OJF91531.1 hypothetical protein AX762_03175 [Alkalibacterium sp. 20]
MNKKQWFNKFRKIWEDPKAKYVGILVMIIYFIVYLISINHLFFQEGSFELFVVDNPLSRMFVSRAPYVWEPVAAITFGGGSFFLAPMNLLLGIILGILVGSNIMVAVFAYRYRKTCRINTGYGLLGTLPSMLTGFACCAPTFLIALAPALGSFAVYFISLQPFLIPLSILLMVGSLLWSIKQLPIE